MKSQLQIFAEKILLVIISIAIFSNLGCKKEKNVKCQVDNFYWTATIEGVDFCYTSSTYPSTDSGYVLIRNTSPGISTSTLILSDNMAYPSLRFFGNGITLSEGTFVIDSQNSALFTLLISPNEYYTTLNIPDAQFTMEITTFGVVGSFVEGNFMGKVGMQQPSGQINYKNVSGHFKAYRDR